MSMKGERTFQVEEKWIRWVSQSVNFREDLELNPRGMQKAEAGRWKDMFVWNNEWLFENTTELSLKI